MPGRTENNVKNRFNYLFKSIKDEIQKNRSSIDEMDDKKQLDEKHCL